MTKEELDEIAKELGVDAFAPVEPIEDKSLFGNKNETNVSRDDSGIMTDKEWHDKKMPFPAFYNTHA